jgi:predicted site-specific integrase-resolvase
MTRTEFRALPLLVKPAQAAELLGLTVRKLSEAYNDGRLVPVLTKRGHRRYPKHQLARLVGLEDAL